MTDRVGVVLLVLSGAVLVLVGATGLLAPDVLHEAGGLPAVADPGSRSESRAAGALLLAVGSGVLMSARVVAWRPAGGVAAAVALLAYAVGRGVAWVLDGSPGPDLALAGLVELLLGASVGAWAVGARFGAHTPDRVSSAPR